MAFTTNMSAVAQLDDSIVLEYEKQFIIAAADMGIMDQFATYKKQINAKSIEFPKYAQLALQTSALDEDDDVTSEAMSDSQILLTPAEYGNAITTTRLANLQTGGRADLAAAKLVGINAGRSMDKLAILAAEASGNQLFGKAAGSEAALVATDVIDVDLINRLYNKLKRTGVAPLGNGQYVLVLHDDVAFDLRNATGVGSWQDISKYTGSVDQIFKGEIGSLMGFRVVIDSNISVNTDAGASAVDSYHCLALGYNALGKAESDPMKMVVSGPFDKLQRFANIGWHTAVKYGIVDTDACFVGTVASSVGVNA